LTVPFTSPPVIYANLSQKRTTTTRNTESQSAVQTPSLTATAYKTWTRHRKVPTRKSRRKSPKTAQKDEAGNDHEKLDAEYIISEQQCQTNRLDFLLASVYS
jgi:hypothetical protein